MLSVEQGSIKYNFWVFGITQPGIEPQSPGPLANTLLIRPMLDEAVDILHNTNTFENSMYPTILPPGMGK